MLIIGTASLILAAAEEAAGSDVGDARERLQRWRVCEARVDSLGRRWEDLRAEARTQGAALESATEEGRTDRITGMLAAGIDLSERMTVALGAHLAQEGLCAALADSLLADVSAALGRVKPSLVTAGRDSLLDLQTQLLAARRANPAYDFALPEAEDADLPELLRFKAGHARDKADAAGSTLEIVAAARAHVADRQRMIAEADRMLADQQFVEETAVFGMMGWSTPEETFVGEVEGQSASARLLRALLEGVAGQLTWDELGQLLADLEERLRADREALRLRAEELDSLAALREREP